MGSTALGGSAASSPALLLSRRSVPSAQVAGVRKFENMTFCVHDGAFILVTFRTYISDIWMSVSRQLLLLSPYISSLSPWTVHMQKTGPLFINMRPFKVDDTTLPLPQQCVIKAHVMN